MARSKLVPLTMWSCVFSSVYFSVCGGTKQWLNGSQGKISGAVGHVCVTPTVIYSYSNITHMNSTGRCIQSRDKNR